MTRTKEHKENTHSAAMVQWSHEDYPFDINDMKFGGIHSTHCACPVCYESGGKHYSYCLCPPARVNEFETSVHGI